MSTKHLLDESLWPLLETLGNIQFSAEALPMVREMFMSGVTLADLPGGISREEIQLPSAHGPDVRALLYKPADGDGLHPAYLHIHGGGYVIGSPEMADATNLSICQRLGAVVVSVDYRLAPEHPIPAPLEDCYAGLAWLHGHADELQVDPARIAIGGESAGGGLAAALALLARERSEYAICHQHLTYPMLDDRTGRPESLGDPLVGEFVWTRDSNRFGWDSYLGDAERAAPQVPARAESLEGLPATWLFTASLDLFRDENITYAQRLLAAGVPTEFVLFAGACHGFQGVPDTDLGNRYARDSLAALARGLGVALT